MNFTPRPPPPPTPPNHHHNTTDISNDKLSGVTLFSLAAPEALEELFKSIARLLSTAALDEQNPAYFATAAAKAAPLAHPVRCVHIYIWACIVFWIWHARGQGRAARAPGTYACVSGFVFCGSLVHTCA